MDKTTKTLQALHVRITRLRDIEDQKCKRAAESIAKLAPEVAEDGGVTSAGCFQDLWTTAAKRDALDAALHEIDNLIAFIEP